MTVRPAGDMSVVRTDSSGKEGGRPVEWSAFVARNPVWVVETLTIAGLIVGLWTSESERWDLQVIWNYGTDLFRVIPALYRMDGAGAVWEVGAVFLRFCLTWLPLGLLAVTLRGWERSRIATWILVSPLAYPFCVQFDSSTGGWAGLIVLSLCGVLLGRRRWFRWTVLLPFLVLLKYSVMHLSGNLLIPHGSLAERCRTNDGRRPLNVRAEQFGPSWISINPLDARDVLLAGKKADDQGLSGNEGSWWLRRTDQGWMFEAPSNATGPLDMGCSMDGAVWLNNKLSCDVIGAAYDPTTRTEQIRRIVMCDHELADFGEMVCRRGEDHLIVNEGFSGSQVWDVDPRTGRARRLAQDAGGLGPLLRNAFGRTLVGIDFTHLLTYSLDEERTTWRTPAGLFISRVESCHDGDLVAVPDAGGRVRFFTRNSAGHYEFSWSVPFPASVRAAFSDDCHYLAVTSGDDRTVGVIDTQAHNFAATFNVGPSLHGIVFTGPRELSVADACTMTTLKL